MEAIKYNFSIISSAVFVPIGVIGNIISIVIFGHSQFRKQPIATYLIIVSIINITVIIQIPNQLLNNYWTGISDWNILCKLTIAIFIITRKAETWTVSLCSVDRMVTVMAPMKFQFKDTKTFQIVSVILICLINVAADFPIYFSTKSYAIPNNETLCFFPLEPDYFWFTQYSQISLTIFGSGLPFLIMITSSVLIVWTLLKSKVKLSRSKRFQKELNLTRSLVLMDAFFILTALPMVIDVYINLISDLFVYEILYMLSNFYNIFLFLLFFSFNKLYRAIFYNLFRNLFPKK